MHPPLSSQPPPSGQTLPYADVKPVGAADFYAAVNATFRFISRRFGQEGLLRYWEDLGTHYYAPVTRLWQQGGLAAVAAYWHDFFAAEPGAEVSVETHADRVELQVHACPAIRYLREHQREIHPQYCQHCQYVSAAIGRKANIEVRVKGGSGSCIQTFAGTGVFKQPQIPEDIATVL